jgi:hypothetical protein
MGTVLRQGDGSSKGGTVLENGDGSSAGGTVLRQGDGSSKGGTVLRQEDGSSKGGTVFLKDSGFTVSALRTEFCLRHDEILLKSSPLKILNRPCTNIFLPAVNNN